VTIPFHPFLISLCLRFLMPHILRPLVFICFFNLLLRLSVASPKHFAYFDMHVSPPFTQVSYLHDAIRVLRHGLEARRVVGGGAKRWAMLSSSSRRSFRTSKKEGNGCPHWRCMPMDEKHSLRP
jgi:hypothetical protein